MHARAWAGALLVSCALAAGATPALAQSPPAAPETFAVGDWQLAPTLQLRTRAEYRRDPPDLGGNGSPRVTDAIVVLERARVGLGAERGALRAQVTLQDAHAWGSLPPTATILPGQVGGQFGAYEAYVEARTSAARPSFIRIGRQAVTWGEGRLVGAADWSPAGRSLDAARARLSLGVLDVELLAALLAPTRPLGAAFDDTTGPSSGGEELYGAQAAWAADPLLKIELSLLARVTQGGAHGRGASRFSFSRASGETYVGSLRVAGEGRGWRYGVQGAYEMGHATSLDAPTTSADRKAWAAAAHLARTFDGIVLTPTLRLGGAYASGDDGGTTYRQFDPLLPDVHTWHGAMDLFAWSNIVEANAKVGLVPWTDTSLAFEYRYARLAESGGDWLNAYLGGVGRAPGNGSAELGHELDVVFSWQPWPVMELVAGYSGLLLGDGARTILATRAFDPVHPTGSTSPAALAHLGYLQMTVNVP